MLKFSLEHEDPDSSARSGTLSLNGQTLPTPAFMPVGTLGTVKSLSPEDLESLDYRLILNNAYHLYLRPGLKTLRRLGGSRGLTGWQGLILTDSGGYQAYSLSRHVSFEEEGVTFISHLDGSSHRLTPEKVLDIQQAIGSDIWMPLDVVVPGDSDLATTEAAMTRTTRWLARTLHYHRRIESPTGTVFPIVQGAAHAGLRRRHAHELAALDTEGYAIGGLSVGEERSQRFDMLSLCDEALPRQKPRYLMGVGTPDDLVEGIRRGVDLFDCVLPTRNARNGQIFSQQGPLRLLDSRFARDESPLDDWTSPQFSSLSRAYAHHMLKVEEPLFMRVLSLHNLAFIQRMMREVRRALVEQRFAEWSKEFLARYLAKAR